jgi:hypothetical protein
MRGTDERSGSLFSYVDLEARVTAAIYLKQRARMLQWWEDFLD